jgi:hypothetical protein
LGIIAQKLFWNHLRILILKFLSLVLVYLLNELVLDQENLNSIKAMAKH